MKKITGYAMAIILAAFMFTSCTRVDPTEVGFKIENSGDYRGIDSLPLLTGWQWFTPGFSYIVTIPTTQQHKVWTADATEGSSNNEEITVSCAGGAGFKMDVGLNYRVIPNKASKIYLKYKTGDLESITNTYLRTVVRGTMQDLSSTMTVDSILNNLGVYEHTVAKTLTDRLAAEGFMVDNFNILRQPTPTDKDLANAINLKIKAKQDAETSKMQLQQSIAEANKAIATARGDSAVKVIKATGEAEAVKRIQQVLSPTYVEYVKWSNANPNTPRVPATIIGSGAGVLYSPK